MRFCTVQCAVAALCKLLSTVFVCLQERSSAFGPCVYGGFKTLQEFGNVYVTVAK